MRSGKAMAIRMPHLDNLASQDTLAEVRHLLATLVEDAEAERWLYSTVHDFGDRRPIDMIHEGDGEIVIATLGRLNEGIPY
jgi:uncharacterized protein (DUF2384 family)